MIKFTLKGLVVSIVISFPQSSLAGYAFQDAEFLPKGTRDGVVGGIPPGKRAMTLDASKIGGIHALQAGDHLDLLASAPIDEKKFRGENAGLLQARNLASSAVGQADVRVIVHDGVIVSPVTTRGWCPRQRATL